MLADAQRLCRGIISTPTNASQTSRRQWKNTNFPAALGTGHTRWRSASIIFAADTAAPIIPTPFLVTDANGAVLESIAFWRRRSWAITTLNRRVCPRPLDGLQPLELGRGLAIFHETVGSHTAFAPRFGFAYSPGSSGRTVLHGRAGVFYDREPLLAAISDKILRAPSASFPPGTLLGPPVVYTNMYGMGGARRGVLRFYSTQRPDYDPLR